MSFVAVADTEIAAFKSSSLAAEPIPIAVNSIILP